MFWLHCDAESQDRLGQWQSVINEIGQWGEVDRRQLKHYPAPTPTLNVHAALCFSVT